MREIKVYTAGKMKGTTLQEQLEWRAQLEQKVRIKQGFYDDAKVRFVHPPNFFNYSQKEIDDREILDWEMMQLHSCDVVVVNLKDVENSVGTVMELGCVQGINRFGDKYIFVLGIGEKDKLHPWIKKSCNKVVNSVCDASEYILNYLTV